MNARVAVLFLAILSAPWTWHAEAGGQVDSAPHFVVNAGVRRGDLSLELSTDTLEIWWRPEFEGGRAFLGLRGQAFGSEMMIAPWSHGAEDPSRGLTVPHFELALGIVDYLPLGFYVGLRGSARGYFFFRRSDTTIEPPDPTLVLTPQLFVGWWSPDASIEISAGADLRDGFVSGRSELHGAWKPQWTIGPRIEAAAGAGYQLDDLTLTRLGGLNPYVVPLAGAAWAEWWVEDYAAIRAGPQVAWAWGSLAAVIDAAVFDAPDRKERFDDPFAIGFALLARVTFWRCFLDASFGYAPWIDRQEGVLRVSGWLLVGTQSIEL